MSVLNFYKIKTESTLKYILYGWKIKNIEFLQTFINLFWTKYLEWKTSKANVVKFRRKLHKLLNIRYQEEPLGYNALTLPN